MINVHKQVGHWLNGSEEDIAVARELLEKKRVRHSLFFAHLALEKALKAHVCQATGDLAPPIHNVSRLDIAQDNLDLFAEVNEFNIEGRYPGTSTPMPSEEEAEMYLQRIGDVLTWLKSQLKL